LGIITKEGLKVVINIIGEGGVANPEEVAKRTQV
jgi:hypothetical protein